MEKLLGDVGSMHICIPPEVARELGFDIEEMPTMLARVADGRLIRVPAITPTQIDFGNRSCTLHALLMGNEVLMGVLALEAMDLIVNPVKQRVEVNPLHPDCAVFPA